MAVCKNTTGLQSHRYRLYSASERTVPLVKQRCEQISTAFQSTYTSPKPLPDMIGHKAFTCTFCKPGENVWAKLCYDKYYCRLREGISSFLWNHYLGWYCVPGWVKVTLSGHALCKKCHGASAKQYSTVFLMILVP